MKRSALAIGVALLLAAGGAVALVMRNEPVTPVPSERAAQPPLALLTSLPLMFAEGFGLEGGGSPALTRLEERYDVVPIGIADGASLKGQRLLLMAQPRAQPAEVLVELDRWVREGGRVLLLADPLLTWESERPLGDPLRPALAFADTGLLDHWGVRLSGPYGQGGAGEGSSGSAGKLASDRCELSDDGLIARCAVGRGRATIIADADFLNGEPRGLDLLISELDRLER